MPLHTGQKLSSRTGILLVVWCVWNVNFLARIPRRTRWARQNFGQLRHAKRFGIKGTLQESILYGTKVTGVN